MEILVCIKQVPDDSVNIKMNPATNAPDLDIATPIVNAFDTYALEMATRLKEAVGTAQSLLFLLDQTKLKMQSKLVLRLVQAKVILLKPTLQIQSAQQTLLLKLLLRLKKLKALNLILFSVVKNLLTVHLARLVQC